MRRIHYQTVGSTNDEARGLVPHYFDASFLVTAETQRAGRGRRGRSWNSPSGGAWMSVAWRMRREPAFYTPAPLIAALAVYRVVRRAIERADPDHDTSGLRIKWPNDLLVDGEKAAGILCESVLPARVGPGAVQAEARIPPDFLVMGVGINVDFEADRLPPETLAFPATTLRTRLGCGVPVEPVIEDFRVEIHRLMNGFEASGLTASLLGQLRGLLAFDGRTVEVVRESGEPVVGRQVGLDDEGRLLVETAAGVRACAAGEIVHCRPGR